MRKLLSCLAIMPVGPRSNVDFVQDTVDSFFHYFTDPDSLLAVLDDTRDNALVERLAYQDSSRVRIIDAQSLLVDETTRHNTRGLLFVKQILALQSLQREFVWTALLRLDDDALVVGSNPHLDAIEAFSKEPTTGMLGAYQRRGDGTDKRAALRRQGRRLIKRLVSRDIINYPDGVKTLFMLVVRAKMRGYKLGDMCTGGALFISGIAYAKMENLFGEKLLNLRYSDLADDLLLALCLGASGFKFKDFSDAEDIMAINWRGLPMPLEEIKQRGKKIMHPVKDPKNKSHEHIVRSYFRDFRYSDSE